MRYMLFVAGTLTLLVGLGFVFPQIANWRDSGSQSVELALLTLGGLLTLAGLSIVGAGLRRYAR